MKIQIGRRLAFGVPFKIVNLKDAPLCSRWGIELYNDSWALIVFETKPKTRYLLEPTENEGEYKIAFDMRLKTHTRGQMIATVDDGATAAKVRP